MIFRYEVLLLSLMLWLTFVLPGSAHGEPINHDVLDDALRGDVGVDGSIKYSHLRDHRAGILLAYLDTMANIDVDLLSRKEQLAYYLNVYNATVITHITQNLRDGFSPAENDSKMFDEKIVRLSGGRTASLNDLEATIRSLFKDPRTHAALVKGFKSSPALRQTAYRGENVDAALDEQLRKFINDPERNTIDRNAKTLKLSKIFEENAPDFGGSAGLAAYVSKFADGGAVDGFAVGFADFDTSLNAF